jgi:hypothetical protein
MKAYMLSAPAVLALDLDVGGKIGTISASSILNVADPALTAVRRVLFTASNGSYCAVI